MLNRFIFFSWSPILKLFVYVHGPFEVPLDLVSHLQILNSEIGYLQLSFRNKASIKALFSMPEEHIIPDSENGFLVLRQFGISKQFLHWWFIFICFFVFSVTLDLLVFIYPILNVHHHMRALMIKYWKRIRLLLYHLLLFLAGDAYISFLNLESLALLPFRRRFNSFLFKSCLFCCSFQSCHLRIGTLSY